MLLAIGLLLSAHANAALNAYLTLEGETQGVIEGSTVSAPHEGKITVHGYSHNNGDGPNWQDCKEGTSSHEPLMIIKDRDKSTPLLYTADAIAWVFTDGGIASMDEWQTACGK